MQYSIFFPHKVVGQSYEVYVEMEHVILGNDALLKCKIPSHVADFLSVEGWVNSDGEEFLSGFARGNSNAIDRTRPPAT